MNETELLTLMKQRGLHPKKLLGQNFLTSEPILQTIVASAGLSKNDTVLEVGAGLGALTIELAAKADKVVAVEKDPELAGLLEELLADRGIHNVTVVCGDIFRSDIKKLLGTRYRIVANIPYYLTSRFIKTYLADAAARPEVMILMIQKEVAERIVADPPEMSLLSVSVQAFADARIIIPVPRTSFTPAPKVDSVVIRISPRDVNVFKENETDEKVFFALARAAFQQKRKVLANSLSRFFGGKPEAEKIIRTAGLLPGARPQELTIENWLFLSKNASENAEK